jgi:hypothetical protein
MTENPRNQQIIKVGTQVELRPGMDAVYRKAVPGSRAVVLAEKEDDDGFEMVKVRWDRKHWRYNGEPDGWKYKSHFQPARRQNLHTAQEDPVSFAAHLVERARELGGDDDEIEHFIDKLNEIVSLLSESEGFIVLVAREEDSPTQPDDKVLIPYTYGGFLSSRSQVLLESQLMNMAGAAHLEMAQRMFRRYQEEEDDE